MYWLRLLLIKWVRLTIDKIKINSKNMYHLIPRVFSQRETNALSSTLSGKDARSTWSNWYELLARVFKAYLHLYLSINPYLLRSNSTKMFVISYLLKIPVLKPIWSTNKYLAFVLILVVRSGIRLCFEVASSRDLNKDLILIRLFDAFSSTHRLGF